MIRVRIKMRDFSGMKYLNKRVMTLAGEATLSKHPTHGTYILTNPDNIMPDGRHFEYTEELVDNLLQKGGWTLL